MMAQGIKPRYAFGFGLSYTTFDYSNLKIKSKGDTVSVSFNVKNSGGVDGTDIPRLYLAFPTSAMSLSGCFVASKRSLLAPARIRMLKSL